MYMAHMQHILCMSIHINLTDEARAQLAQQQRRSTLFSFLISIGVIVVLGVLLQALFIFIPEKRIETIVTYQAESVDLETVTEPTIKKQTRTTPTPPAASSAVANVITTSAPTAISVPDTNQFLSVDAPDFGSSNDFGMGFGFDGEAQSEGVMTAFGRVSSNGMRGYLYDLKQHRRGRKDVDFAAALSHVKEHNFDKDSFKDYYQADVPLSFSYLAIDNSPADLGPQSFQAEGEIQPMRWFAVYDGTLKADHKRQVRFLGRFDDLILVYLNDRIIFDGSWGPEYSDVYSDCNSRGERAGYPRILRRTVCIGDYVRLNAGDRLRIVVAEIPGGRMGGGLFIEEKGVKNPGHKDDGAYRYVPFSTGEISDEDAKILEAKEFPVEVKKVPVFEMNDQ